MYESVRWKIIKHKMVPGQMIFDKILDKPVVEIATGNQQIDEIMIKVCFECMHNTEFLKEMMRRLE